MKLQLFISVFIIISSLQLTAQEDPYVWLEDVDGTKAMDFVNAQNQKTISRLSTRPEYKEIYDKTLEVLDSKDKIADPSQSGKYIYNFWKDDKHIRGIWRRTTPESYFSADPKWETLIDIDDLSEKEGVNWVFHGSTGLYPDYNLFLVTLSRGGGDAGEVREFDANKKQFVSNGFNIPESKSGASWLDKNNLIVNYDGGEGNNTTSGYPNQVKIWKRGTPLESAQLIFEGDKTDVSSGGYLIRDGNDKYVAIYRGNTFYTSEKYIRQNDKLIKLDLPADASLNELFKNQLLIELKSDWNVNNKTYKQGTLISLDFKQFLKGNTIIQTVYSPDKYSSLSSVSRTKNKLLINVMSNVKNDLYICTFANGTWTKQKVNSPGIGSIGIGSTNESNDNYFFYFSNFLYPSTLYYGDAKTNTYKKIKALPAFFDASKYKVEQFKVKSKDGTMIPYFVVSSKKIKLDGTNPTLLYAYGGFEVPMQPSYSATRGPAWLDRGGVYVLANIRGGGEFGPAWHLAGLKEKRQNVYNDFYAVAEDLINRKYTSSPHLGIMGGSNGGLLMGVSFTQRPELFNAVCCMVPLLDMQRYNKLLAGASWMGEYGNPDIPEEWEYISKYSPYQNLKSDMKYPEVFFYTSTRDDRVHPGHARKMAAKMIDMGYPVLYYENIEGGHGGSTTNEQTARMNAMNYTYLLMKLK